MRVFVMSSMLIRSVLIQTLLITVSRSTDSVTVLIDTNSTANSTFDEEYVINKAKFTIDDARHLMLKFCNKYCIDGNGTIQVLDDNLHVDSACMACRCDEDCSKYGDCCPNISGIRKRDDDIHYVCVNTYDVQYHNQAYFMIRDCSETPGDDSFSLSPVYAPKTGDTYVNSEIAACHNQTDVIAWSQCQIPSCFWRNNSKILARNCDIVHSFQPYVSGEIISVCNSTGHWNLDDKNLQNNLEDFCAHFDSPFKSIVVYRNLFCFLCNPSKYTDYSMAWKRSRGTSHKRLSLKYTYQPRRFRKYSSFLEIVQFDGIFQKPWRQSFSPRKVRIICPLGYIYAEESNQCTRIYQGSIEVIEYHLQLLLYTRTPLSVLVQTLQDQFWKQVGESLKPFVRSLAESVNATLYLFSVGEFIEKPNWWQKWKYSDTPIYLSTRIQVDSNSSRDGEYIASILEILNHNIFLAIENHTVMFESILFNGTFKTEINYEMKIGKCCSENSDMEFKFVMLQEDIVFYEMYCPYVSATEGESYELVDKGIRLVFKGLDNPSTIVEGLYTVHGHDTITLCEDVYYHYYNKTWEVSRLFALPISENKWIVLTVFMSFSSIGLFATFVTYCMFPSLQTIPAKNNMSLIFCMFMSNMLYLHGFFRTDTNQVCQIIGACLHYFLLSSIFWMNVCCYHVFKGFVRSRNIRNAPLKTSRILFVYCMYANGLSALIVATVLTTNLILSNGLDAGYGGHYCYLSTVPLIVLAFVIPLCCVLLSNLFFFATTIYTISNTKQVRRNTGGDRKNLWVYIKLSSITGIFWIVTILAAALDSVVLDYVAVVLNCSQGVFLFLSYCVNKRVLRLWKEKVLNQEASGSESTISRTRSTLVTKITQSKI